MNEIALLARLLLAAVLGFAAVTKLADRGSSRLAVAEFGVPSVLVPAVAFALPFVELAIALALVPASSAGVAAIAAFVLLGAFVLAIVVNLARGRRPDCNCFGQAHAKPIGPGLVVRDVVLMGLAAVVIAAGGGESVAGWWHGLDHAGRVGVVLGAAVLIEALGLWSLFVRYGRLLVRVEELTLRSLEDVPALAPAPGGYGLPVGSVAPAFELRGLFGEVNTLAALLARGRPVVLLFTDPGCGPCGALTPEVAQWQRSFAASLTIAMISRGSETENADKFVAAGVGDVLLQHDTEVAAAYASSPTPSGVLIDPEGRIASTAAVGADAIRRLVTEAAGVPSVPVALGTGVQGSGNGHDHGAPQPQPAPALSIGDPAPEVVLPDLDGNTVELASFRGRPVLVVFWNPTCGFCTDLLPRLREWEERRGDDGPELVIVTTGSLEANRALGFRSTVLLDDPFAVGPRFGANGTPMAIVIDGDGRIASDLAIGGPALMDLAAGALV
jgi:thiol-disulfide isomerase/thioredoxin